MVHLGVHFVWTSSHLDLDHICQLCSLLWLGNCHRPKHGNQHSQAQGHIPSRRGLCHDSNKFGKVIHIPAWLPCHLSLYTMMIGVCRHKGATFFKLFQCDIIMVHCVPIDHCDKSCNEAPGFSCTEQLSNHRTTCLASHYFVSARTDVEVISSWFLSCSYTLMPDNRYCLSLILVPWLIPNRSEGFMKGYYPAGEQSCFIFQHTWQHDALLYRSALRPTVSSAGSRFASMFVFFVFVWVTRSGVTQERVNTYFHCGPREISL